MESLSSPGAVEVALVLAAGNGDRFRTSQPQSKLLHPFLGRPIILRTLEHARAAGITTAEVVTGYGANALRDLITRHPIQGLSVRFTHNPEWRLENGVSALAAAPRLRDRRFALLMGDHLFEPAVLRRLLSAAVAPGDSLLAVDGSAAEPAVAAEATRVRLRDRRIVAIGKGLDPYDALDTGLFVCDPSLFAALEAARAAGDTTLSGGIRQLAAEGRMHALDVEGAAWHDIDTTDDLLAAETARTDSAAAPLPVVA